MTNSNTNSTSFCVLIMKYPSGLARCNKCNTGTGALNEMYMNLGGFKYLVQPGDILEYKRDERGGCICTNFFTREEWPNVPKYT